MQIHCCVFVQYLLVQLSPRLHHLGRRKCGKIDVEFAPKLSRIPSEINRSCVPAFSILVFVAFWLPCNAFCLLAGAGHACCSPSAIPAPYIFTFGFFFLDAFPYFPTNASVLLRIEILSFCESTQTYFLHSEWEYLEERYFYVTADGIRICNSIDCGSGPLHINICASTRG